MNLAHLHLLLNHIPIIGAIIGLGLLVVSLAAQSDDLKRASLMVLAAIALLSLPAFFSGVGARGAIRKDTAIPAGLIERHEGSAILALSGTVATGPALQSPALVVELGSRPVLFSRNGGAYGKSRRHRR